MLCESDFAYLPVASQMLAQLCHAPRAQILRFPFRVRLCKSCDNEKFSFTLYCDGLYVNSCLISLIDLDDLPLNSRAVNKLGYLDNVAAFHNFVDLLPFVERDPCDNPRCRRESSLGLHFVISLVF